MKSDLRLVQSSPTRCTSEAPRRGSTPAQRRNEIFALVYRQMRALAGPCRDLDDLAQLAAEQVLLSLPRFEDRSALATWTYRICHFTLSKHRRWYRRWIRRFSYISDRDAAEPADHALLSVESFEQRERAVRLRQALERVPVKRRTVVILHDLEELELEEVAIIVGAKVNTVRSRLRDGRRLLAQILAQDPYFGDYACSEEDG